MRALGTEPLSILESLAGIRRRLSVRLPFADRFIVGG